MNESDETNNRLTGDTDVTIRPADLVVAEVITPPENYSGEYTTIQWVVRNVGEHAVWPGTAYWDDEIWLSPDPTLNRVTKLGTVAYDHQQSLLPGESYTAELQARLPAGIEGQYYIYVRTNSDYAKHHESSSHPWPPEGGDNWISRYRYFPVHAFEHPFNNLGQLALARHLPGARPAGH